MAPGHPTSALAASLTAARELGWAVGLTLGAAALLWFLFFNAIHDEWRINPQYGYGYIVPLLGLALTYRRWADRPAPRDSRSPFVAWIAGALLLLLLPWNLCLEANPEWRLLYWFSGFQVIALSCCLLYRLGGWPWVRHFFPPLAFMLIAAPWPMQFEQSVVQGLMRLVAGLTVDVVGLLGIPALQHGNLIEVGTGIVGIDEACSGVRSLQSALMLSLFLGELNRFSSWRRLALLGASLVFVLAANLARTTFLVWTAASRGLQRMEAVHDTAGLIVMLVALPGLVLLAHLLRTRAEKNQASHDSAHQPVRLPFLPAWFGVSAILWVGVCLCATMLWYRAHENGLVRNAAWSVSWPKDRPGFAPAHVPEKSLAILRCTDSEAASWEDDSGNLWSGFMLRWEAGRNSAQLAKGHRPEICFPASGARLLQDFGPLLVPVGGLQLPFHHETFETGGSVVHVFYCLWSDRTVPEESALLENGSELSRLRAVRDGIRNSGQQVLEVVIRGPDSSDQAVSLFTEAMRTMIQMEPNPVLGHPSEG